MKEFNSQEKVDLLRSNGIYFDRDEFLGQLKVPADCALTEFLKTGPVKPVWAAHQIYLECSPSIISRTKLLADMEEPSDLFPFFLWVDTDRTGAAQEARRFFWPVNGVLKTISLCSRHNNEKDAELRFTLLNVEKVQKAGETIWQYICHSMGDSYERRQAKRKYDRLKCLFSVKEHTALSEFDHRITYHLLNHHLGFDPFSVILSKIMDAGLLTDAVNRVINRIRDVIAIFNESMRSWSGRGIDPGLRPLAGDYLPLHFSCPEDNVRLKLFFQKKGADSHAVTKCLRCGREYNFYLGGRSLSIDELARTKRWSPDIMLPLFMNDITSGYVGGRSSGIYFGLVMKDVLEKVLDVKRIPILLPEDVWAHDDESRENGNLIYTYFTQQGSENRERRQNEAKL